jgi:hypothetical protein
VSTRGYLKTKTMNWISVKESLPEVLETVWISNGKGWTTLGCRTDYFEGDNGELNWCWASIQNGLVYQQGFEIVAECEADDLDVKYWHKLPTPIIENTLTIIPD